MSDVDDVVEGVILGLLEGAYRMERAWDAGSDHSVELADIDSTLADLVGLIGTDVYRAGSPQRVALDERIAGLAARQEVLAAEEVRPAGWTWQPTDELFSDWWAEQDVKAKNIWLRSMGVRVEFDREQKRFDFGDIEALTERTTGGRGAAAYKEFFAGLRGIGVRGMETWPPDRYTQTTVVTLVEGEPEVIHMLTDEGEAAAAEFYGWDTEEDP